MFRTVFLATFALLVASLAYAADELAEKWQKRIADAESTFATAVAKADKARLAAVQKANAERMKTLKAALAEATKAGDFNAGTILKQKLTAAEVEGQTSPKPKNIVKFGGHEYALIAEKAPWHVAKRICEEMGGHLACVESPDEEQFVRTLCGPKEVWFGGTDEEVEGQWKWCHHGTPVQLKMQIDNDREADHYLAIYGGTWFDTNAGHRYDYVCEWE